MSRSHDILSIAILASSSFAISAGRLGAQTEPIEGLRENPPRVHALVGGRVVVSPGRVLEKATVVLRDGLIEAAGTAVSVPPDARRHDCAGLTIYAGLIESYLKVELPAEAGSGDGRHWHRLVRPERAVEELWRPKIDELRELRALGFCAALAVPAKGIFRGQSALALLGEGKRARRFLTTGVAQHVAFERTGDRKLYPNSLMGSIALIRQCILDARWYARAAGARGPDRPKTDSGLAALDFSAPFAFEVGSERDLARARRIGREFGLELWLRGSGSEYKRLTSLGAEPLILPLAFPESPEVAAPEDSEEQSLAALMHFVLAPENPVRVHRSGRAFSLTTDGLAKRADFPARLRRALRAGLPYDEALRALTVLPAALCGVSKLLGTIEAGKIANLVVSEGPLFAEESKLRDVWVDGERYPVEPRPLVDPRGTWTLRLELDARLLELVLAISGDEDRLTATIRAAGEAGEQAAGAGGAKGVAAENVRLGQRRLTFGLDAATLVKTSGAATARKPSPLRLSGAVDADRIVGRGVDAQGRAFRWAATRVGDRKIAVIPRPGTALEGETLASDPEPLATPFGAFGRHGPPPREDIVLRGATVWTQGPLGKLSGADLYVRGGKIAAVGREIVVPEGIRVVDARGKHVTPGLIDAHSHVAIEGGVNEGTQAVTAEVRIGDAVNPDDINLYRQLAGGLTVSNLLHGSANPIGGQSQVIKLRWGADAEGLKCEGAEPAIKFALGENVKQSNWGDDFQTRYPQTRMGVEQLLRDRFEAAQAYVKALAGPPNGRGALAKEPGRRDLELEALGEVLEGKRAVHCHSYRQDEILMLIRVADDFSFRLGTLQHILEGYKVAEHMAKHGVHASTFSDWWAYKYEVIDAIPYNGAILHDVGVVVSFNSDSAELARRLNLEAAKAVKYGGLADEEAFAFVTSNPARQLGISDRVGSLEKGKDADFVVWSGDPLSTYTRCEQTWIEGRRYFDVEDDARMRARDARERAKYVSIILARGREDRERRKKEALDATAETPGRENRR